MAARNYSMWDYLNNLAAERKPLLTFEGKTKADWERWRREFSAKLMELCGEWPQQVDPKPEVIYSLDEGFPIEASLRAHEHLRRSYMAAGVEGKLHVDVFLGGHQFHGPSAREFFDKYL